MQYLLTQEEYDTLKNASSEELEKFKDEYSKRTGMFIVELARWMHDNSYMMENVPEMLPNKVNELRKLHNI